MFNEVEIDYRELMDSRLVAVSNEKVALESFLVGTTYSV